MMLALALLLGAAQGSLTSNIRGEVHQRSWNQYMRQFGKNYGNAAEHARRQQLYFEAVARVQAHNEEFDAGHVAHRLAINHLSDRSADELRNWGHSKRHSRRAKVVPRVLTKAAEEGGFDPDERDFELTPESDLPKSVDWSTADNRMHKSVSTTPYNQQSCGSCWAFAATEVLESQVAINNGTLTKLSPQQLVSCMPNKDACGGKGGCEGATAELAFAHWFSSEAVSQQTMSYTGSDSACTENGAAKAASITGWKKLPENDYLAILNAIAKVGPLVISVDAGSWGGYSSGIFHDNSYDNDINHAVVLVGYGEDAKGNKYWKVRNSWGPTWGESGYIRLHRQSEKQCGTDSTPCDGTGCKGECHDSVEVCGTSGILYDVSYPTGARLE